MDEDSILLKKELEINNQRLKKLEEHKKSIEPQLKNPKSNEESQRLLETMKRLEKNLQIEYKKRDGIINAIKTKEGI
ncbi:hypothetical protein [Candidatus Nitrosopumilus sediminis]|uniref:Uncharacterized protein n=1 Tax=Candidatus Nitrosopumilus sediminis TaxID=1229909 RepID=K0B8U6_9ARCH|nr:hypothetical protein [Candidatus Nitrosopumilus sediminis]AFS82618.1 hypothetical protein NSED_04060 [Candidatus Nitrosopumilus sediminis]